MKTVLTLLCLTCPLNGIAQSGGPWSIISSTLESGGRTSTGGPWTLTGTIGQAEASHAPSSNVPFSLNSGFWPGVINSAGGPALLLTRGELHGVPGTVRVEWPSSAAGHQLQYSENLSDWTGLGAPITTDSFTYFGLHNGPRYFFRLKKL